MFGVSRESSRDIDEEQPADGGNDEHVSLLRHAGGGENNHDDAGIRHHIENVSNPQDDGAAMMDTSINTAISSADIRRRDLDAAAVAQRGGGGTSLDDGGPPPPSRSPSPPQSLARRRPCRNLQNCPAPLQASRIQCMAVALVWGTVTSMACAVVWYSYELFHNGTDHHLIAWFSAGAFVLLGFPVSMWGILAHLTNYNHPATQVYIVRILWMVPLYSIQSWLAMRFHQQAVFIETARDCYESYVLYSFLQFLIQVLGGEEALILMLKDKSVTVGHHMWGLQWCVTPWLMGQPVRRNSYYENTNVVEKITAAMSLSQHNQHNQQNYSNNSKQHSRHVKVHWKSPFFVKCKFGVLQYVLLKFFLAVATLVLEYKGWYKEGSFHYTSGYLYICILTNTSQCWALYCLIFFYYATKTELSPIRPVGKFLSVKALVFFTWWQSVFVAVLCAQDMIPTYKAESQDMSSEDVAKSIQDYLICIEMFIAAVVHTFVFPHSEYSVAAVRARANAIHQRTGSGEGNRPRLGRHHRHNVRNNRNNSNPTTHGSSATNNNKNNTSDQEVELVSLADSTGTWCGSDDPEDSAMHFGLLGALLDSAIPRDLRDNTVNIMRGEYNVEKKTLLHHAATSDQYDLFSTRRFRNHHKRTNNGVDDKDSAS